MKYLALSFLLTFSLSALADDLSFGSFSVEERAQVQASAVIDLSFASFESEDSNGRGIANTNKEAAQTVDPVAFGSFE
jgi:hypothetical protein